LTEYRCLGFDADGYDPHAPFGYATKPPRRFRVVTLFFVLNVLPTVSDRLAALQDAAGFLFADGHLVVAARSPSAVRAAALHGNWRACGDGYISHETRSTFQHGLSGQEFWPLETPSA
jgi:hypothetical protein